MGFMKQLYLSSSILFGMIGNGDGISLALDDLASRTKIQSPGDATYFRQAHSKQPNILFRSEGVHVPVRTINRYAMYNKRTAKPAITPKAKPAPKPKGKPAPKPKGKPAVKPKGKPAPKPKGKPALKHKAKIAAKPQGIIMPKGATTSKLKGSLNSKKGGKHTLNTVCRRNGDCNSPGSQSDGEDRVTYGEIDRAANPDGRRSNDRSRTPTPPPPYAEYDPAQLPPSYGDATGLNSNENSNDKKTR